MIKSKLINRISSQFPQLPEKVVADSVSRILEAMSDALADGKRIEIRDFGGFSLRYRAPRNAHNPKNGKKVITLPKYTLHFKPGKDLKQRVNDNRSKPIKQVSVSE